MARYSIMEECNVVQIFDNTLGRLLGDGKEQDLLCGSVAEAQEVVKVMLKRVGA